MCSPSTRRRAQRPSSVREPPARSVTFTHTAVGRAAPSTSSIGPDATVRPRDRIATWSHTSSTSPSRWLERNTVRPSAPQRAHELAYLADAGGIEPVGRFVEDQHFGILQEGDGQAESLAHPERVAACAIVGAFARPTRSSTASTAAAPMPDAVREDRRASARRGHTRVETRRLDQRADAADHAREALAANPAPSSRHVPADGATDPGGSGSSSSCPIRSARGIRTRRRPAPTGRGRRPLAPRRPCAAGTPCADPSTSMTAVMAHPSRRMRRSIGRTRCGGIGDDPDPSSGCAERAAAGWFLAPASPCGPRSLGRLAASSLIGYPEAPGGSRRAGNPPPAAV